MFKQFKLRDRILIGYSLPLIALMTATGLSLWKANYLKDLFQDIKRVDRVIGQSQKLEAGLSELIMGTRGYLISNSNTYLEEYNLGKQAFEESANALQQTGMIIQPEQQQYVQEITQLGEQIEQSTSEVINLVQQGQKQEAIALANAELGAELDLEFEKVSSQLNESERKEIEQDIAKAEISINNLVLTFLLGTLGLSGLSTAIALIIASRATRTILESIGKISSSSNQIAVTVEEQERNANLQAASVNETTTAMDELEATSRQSAEQANAAALAAEQVFQLSDNGNQAVEETLGEMTNLRSKVTAIAEQIMQLSEQTIQIGNISGLVSDLANQTNILALNAAVEAVRAGEHGKGFSVVAAEIRKLADQSKNSAENIRTLVNEIQHKINSAVMVTDEGSKTVDSGIQIANRTAESFAGVAEAVNNMVINNQQISLNTKQQVQAIQQVVEAMNNINLGAKETAIGIGQTKEGTSQLNEATINLQRIV
ncbi:chemotaxis protein [Pleurocapsa sp. CCALA 161]|uniref:methyl-accepting chemotaxis protein n=1 Tax=Pleurocapsa sp. CCALA 161 TaxID=2107688 RepID=UPI000D05EAFC|nr:methyl-accepting chemotaxis protein [Pleurocapsa sp. CCALA 161]PSB06285.1 chemotaxis protein [Pleurocapsa sp. CCALA 161]